MNLDYTGDVRTCVLKVFPKNPNSCRLCVYANAINYLARKTIFTPDEILELINKQRQKTLKEKIELNTTLVTNEDLDLFMKTYVHEINVERYYGAKYLNKEFWLELMDLGFILSSYHQMWNYKNENNLNHLPQDILNKMLASSKFQYNLLFDMYLFLVNNVKSQDLGHTELVLDVKIENGKDYIIFANIGSDRSKSYTKVPFDLYKNYMAFDWENNIPMIDIKQFPNEEDFNKLREVGKLTTNGFNFVYGMIEVFYSSSDRIKLLSAHERFYGN